MKFKELQSAFNKYVTKENKSSKPKELYDPIKYLISLKGKRIRPLLTMLSYNMYHDDINEVLPVAYGVELFHNFTLMHDDIMDEATLRRGKPAVHQKYDVNSAILSGDAMLLMAYKYMMDGGIKADNMMKFNDTAIQICEGQQMDMNFEQSSKVTIDDYLTMIKLKTAVLLGVSLQLGAIKARATSADRKHFYQFGVNLGIAFQLHDDMLDAFGSTEDTGKKQGGDILQRKKTFLHLKTYELLGKKEKAEYKATFESQELSDEERVEKILKFYDQAVVKEYSLQTEEAYMTLAMSHLDAISVDEEKKTVLRDLSNQLMQRKH